MGFLLGFGFQGDHRRPDCRTFLPTWGHRAMGGDQRPLPKCQLEEEEKLPDPSLGSLPEHNAWQRYYKMAKGFRGWAFWTSGKIKVHFKMPSRNSVASLPTLGADGCTTECSLFPETWWLRELGHLQDECPHPLQTLVRGWQTEARGSGVTAKVKS